MFSKKIPQEEKRKYKRLDTIFPVELQVLDANLNPASGWYQAFSQDVSKGGICIGVNNLDIEKPLNLIAQETNLLLQIHSPISERCFLAYAKIAWVKKAQEMPFEQYIIGVSFSKIDAREIDKVLNYVRLKKVIWRTLQLLMIGTILFTALVITNNLRLNSQNLMLLDKYSKLLYRDSELNQSHRKLSQEKADLQKALNESKLEMQALKDSIEKLGDSRAQEITLLEKELSQAKAVTVESSEKDARIKELENKIEELRKARDQDIAKLGQEIASLKERESILNSKLSAAILKESEIKQEASFIEEEEGVLADKFKNQLYRWLKTHEVQRTGLIVSFEGDHNLKGTTFIYDQALAIISYTLFGDYDRAKRGLDFFLHKAEKIEGGGFYNAYYSDKGEVAEYIAHAGPNLWLGIAVLQYTHKTKDYTYLGLAEQIAKWMNSLQDEEGGIFGGKGISWYSTEHNLDGFAFFDMLYTLTQNKDYKNNAQKILGWLNKYAYGNGSIPVNRGKGDSTIATDTYAWSIASLGPKLLKELDMDADGILEFAVENCAVTVDFTNRRGKNIKVSGFDFAKHQNVARGGVVSCEWTAQMVLSFDIMSEYHSAAGEASKAKYYQNQALKYLNELNKMIISSPSAFGQGDWCLPYASAENVDTGHGWRTPKGNRTGSVAGTAYTIFAISKFNPLQLESK